MRQTLTEHFQQTNVKLSNRTDINNKYINYSWRPLRLNRLPYYNNLHLHSYPGAVAVSQLRSSSPHCVRAIHHPIYLP